MIAINELRIGNLVAFKGFHVGDLKYEAGIYRISSIGSDNTIRLYNQEPKKHFGCFKNTFIDPIPLTEEWLLKLGFDNQLTLKSGPFSIEKTNRHGVRLTFTNEFCKNAFKPEINFVHQLQNLCFSLTGEELILKPE